MRKQVTHTNRVTEGAALAHLFSATLQFTSSSPADAVVSPDGREGEYIGSGHGTVAGRQVRGAMRWSLFSASCLYPRIRAGEIVPAELHLCTLNPGGYIDTEDGARISFDGKGYGLRSPEVYRVSVTLAFTAVDARYAWLKGVLGLMEGAFDERAGQATWNVYVPSADLPRINEGEDVPHVGRDYEGGAS